MHEQLQINQICYLNMQPKYETNANKPNMQPKYATHATKPRPCVNWFSDKVDPESGRNPNLLYPRA